MKRLTGSQGVALVPIQESDLDEMLRWRNAEHVRTHFEYDQVIPPEAHRKWWEQLDQSTNFYWKMEVRERGIGILHCKQIDWQERRGEVGIFVGEEDYVGTPYPVLAISMMFEYLFKEIGFKCLSAKVKQTSVKNNHLNHYLGFRMIAEGEFRTYRLDREDFLAGVAAGKYFGLT